MLFQKLKIEAQIWYRHCGDLFLEISTYLMTILWQDAKDLRSSSSIVTLLQQLVQDNQPCEVYCVNPNGEKNIYTTSSTQHS